MKSQSNLNTKNILKLRRYSNGQLAIYLEDSYGFPVAELSIMDNSIDLKENEFIFKDYSENSDLGEELINSKILEVTNRFIVVGSHLCPICKIRNYV